LSIKGTNTAWPVAIFESTTTEDPFWRCAGRSVVDAATVHLHVFHWLQYVEAESTTAFFKNSVSGLRA
jgi:hypothetical protein